MAQARSPAVVFVLAALSLAPCELPAQGEGASPVTVYPVSSFAGSQPASAFDMLAVLPGYAFSESDADIRGFTGAVGNVLIDGSRPAGKQESLESILRRIPATTVERIELIRAGAAGIDMQGQTVLANVVRRREPRTRATIEAGSAFYERGFHAPRLAAETSRRTARDLIELSAAAYQTVDDEHGVGNRARVAADGSVLRDSVYAQDEGDRVREAAAVYERAAIGGQLRVSGSRFEYSRLGLSGDSTLGKSLFYAKPRVLLAWSASDRDRVRMLLERAVGQLDFEDFAGSASLSASTVTAGNPDLEPDRTWRLEVGWERRFAQSGTLLLSLRHERIEDLIDRIPVVDAVPFDAVGNIGDGRRSELALNLTMPLDRFGIRAGLLKSVALWRHSEATDPTTGESRPISEDLSREIAIHFSQHLLRGRVRWGMDALLASAAHEHSFDEVRIERLGTKLDVFAQYEPTPAWNIRLFANNLTGRRAVREREIHDGLRSTTPLRYIETRTLAIGPYFGISVRRAFGS